MTSAPRLAATPSRCACTPRTRARSCLRRGAIERLQLPTSIRVDAGVAEGDEIGTAYDPMIAKLIAAGATRDEALDRLAAALAETEVTGVTTNLPFLRWLVAHPALRARRGDDGVPHRVSAALRQPRPDSPNASGAAPSGSTCRPRRCSLRPTSTRQRTPSAPPRPRARSTAPMPGTVIKVHVHEGSTVKARQPLVVIEAMKMETPLTSPFDATVRAVHVQEGDRVAGGAVLVELDPSYGVVAVAVAALALAGCGEPWQAKVEGPFGTGSDQYWVVRAHGKPKAVVALLHGLAPDSGEQLEPWQVHLAAQGDDVIFPRYEQPPPAPDARDHAVAGIRAGLAKLGHPDAPLVLLGHSRGGRLAVEAAAFLKPKLVIAVYPGTINIKFEPATNFRKIPRSTNIYLLVGDRDEGVGNIRARSRWTSGCLPSAFPAARIHGGVIRSTPQFTADHLSVYDLGGPGAEGDLGPHRPADRTASHLDRREREPLADDKRGGLRRHDRGR